ncbi:Uma2 family endonuclease [Streptomyces olivaceus]|uniref:Uma2 family endonuclease n=1 Tax=Streptomyces olivaceus TaxID=47716 RepID=UPI001CCF622E|nr:Uma2 family endonuclease [Streptomyces olivaceus]MBZ6258071.1 Uma2 family endonuclease [Streptomyces olivaceus]
MVNANTRRLDTWFEQLERVPLAEKFRVEVVGGNVHMTPQRAIHWQIISEILRAVEDRFGRDATIFSNVRIDFPGLENGFCPDVALLSATAEKADDDRWRHQDVEFVAEVISQGTAAIDYGPKRLAYAAAEVPLYLIADPYRGRSHIFTRPQDGDYTTETKVAFGQELDLTGTVLGLTLGTDAFPRD